MLDYTRTRANVQMRKCKCRPQNNGSYTTDELSGGELPCLCMTVQVVVIVASGDISSANMSEAWLSGGQT